MTTLYIEHSAKGSQHPNHKYVKRVWKNGGWHYYYSASKSSSTQRQIDKWFVKKQVKNNPSSAANTVKGAAFIEGLYTGHKINANKAANKKKKELQEQLYVQARNEGRAVTGSKKYQKYVKKRAKQAYRTRRINQIGYKNYVKEKLNQTKQKLINKGKAKVDSIVKKLNKKKRGK